MPGRGLEIPAQQLMLALNALMLCLEPLKLIPKVSIETFGSLLFIENAHADSPSPCGRRTLQEQCYRCVAGGDTRQLLIGSGLRMGCIHRF